MLWLSLVSWSWRPIPRGGGNSGGLEEKLVTGWFELDKERKNGEQVAVGEVLNP